MGTDTERQFEGFQKWYRGRDDVVSTVEERGKAVISSGSCHMRELRELCEERDWALDHDSGEIWIVRGRDD